MKVAEIIETEFQNKKKRNSRYSLRSFALFLDMDPTALQRLMKQERIPSPTTAKKILERLSVSTEQIESCLKSLQVQISENRRPKQFNSMNEKHFEDVFEMKHILVLEALQITGSSFSEVKNKITSSLNITDSEIESILEDLYRIGAIQKKGPVLSVVHKDTSTVPLPFTSKKRRQMQKDFLHMAKNAIDKYDITERDNSTLTVPLHSDDIAEAKRILAQARQRINSLSAKRKNHECVYNISTALYPVIK